MSHDRFVNRHLGPRAAEISEMLEFVGASSMEELIEQTVPANIRLKEPLKLKLNLSMCTKGDKVMLYQDDKKLNPHAEEITLKKNDEVSITMQAEGGFLLVK